MPWMKTDKPSKVERVVSGFCYLTLGLVGLLFIVISGNRYQSSFFRFHFLQSIVVGIILLLAGWTSGIFLSLLSGLIQMLASVLGSVAWQASSSLAFVLEIILKAFNLLPIYGMIWAFFGKFAEIPFISDIVRRQM